MRLLVTVTLNPNQLRAHLEPITDLPEVEGVTLVADEGQPPMAKLRVVVPPAWLVRIAGRAAAKLLTGIVVSLRERPRWVIAYNVVPHAINALVIGRLTRRRVYVHAIGGPVEWEGGGYASDNKVLSRLPGPVPVLERFLLAVLRSCDVVAVMGSRARAALVAEGLDPERVVVLPASVDETRFMSGGEHRRWDLVTAVQLIKRKRVDEFLQVVANLRRERPDVRAAVAGRGPLLEELKAEARRLGIEDAVDFLGFVSDIESVYADARVFVLASQREGLSIAMTEAMAGGVPVVVSDIGEARDVVVDGENGFVYPLGDVDAMTAHVKTLLEDEERWQRMSAAAVEAVRRSSDRATIRSINRDILLTGRGPAGA
jgi:glycosyltransferase involved in cell wall biosynthesis